jgi:hypothetical protein
MDYVATIIRRWALPAFHFFVLCLAKNIQSVIPTQSERYFDRWYKMIQTGGFIVFRC